MSVEIRRDDKGHIDEVVASNATVHLERLGAGKWFLAIEGADGIEEAFWLGLEKRSIVVTFHETRHPAEAPFRLARTTLLK